MSTEVAYEEWFGEAADVNCRRCRHRRLVHRIRFCELCREPCQFEPERPGLVLAEAGSRHVARKTSKKKRVKKGRKGKREGA